MSEHSLLHLHVVSIPVVRSEHKPAAEGAQHWADLLLETAVGDTSVGLNRVVRGITRRNMDLAIDFQPATNRSNLSNVLGSLVIKGEELILTAEVPSKQRTELGFRFLLSHVKNAFILTDIRSSAHGTWELHEPLSLRTLQLNQRMERVLQDVDAQEQKVRGSLAPRSAMRRTPRVTFK